MGRKNTSLIGIFLIFVWGVLLGEDGKSADNKNVDMGRLLEKEKSERQAVMDQSTILLNEARKLASEKRFAEAGKKCLEAKARLGEITGPYAEAQTKKINNLMENIKVQWSKKVEDDARDAYLNGKYEDALALAKESINLYPTKDKDLKSFMDDCSKRLESDKYNKDSDLLTADPDNKVRKDEVNQLLREAQILHKNGRLDKCRDTLEKVLIKDPYNEQATFLLDKVYRKMYATAQKRSENEALERMSEVEWQWNQAVLPTKAVVAPSVKPSTSAEQSGLLEKLQKIVIPEIDFDEAPVKAVISHLKERSRQLDPDGEGVSILLQLSPEKEGENMPRVTMNFDQMPLGDVLKYICQQAGLKYRMEKKALIIGDKDIDEMVNDQIPFRADLVSTILSEVGVAEGEGGKEDKSKNMMESKDSDKLFEKADTFKTSSSGGGAAGAGKKDTSKESQALMDYFSKRGIPFEGDATVGYSKRAGKLNVRNTPENVRKLKQLIRDLDINVPLVLIEAKVLEITDTNLDELGFDWVLTSDNPNRRYNLQPTQHILRTYESLDAKNKPVEGTPPAAVTPAFGKLINNMNILPNMYEDYNLYLNLYALAQTGKAEVLSTPKVIASSGSTAVIQMVRDEYYPRSWSEPEVSITNGSVQISPSYPDFGEPRPIGIRFEVTPQVSSNKYLITLEMHPQVLDLTGWSVYEYTIQVGNITSDPNAQPDRRMQVKMPQISKRSVDTTVKVFDGQTVVLGGINKDESYSRDDKWPFFGEIPILGTLFTNQMKWTEKKNLLMFVTARLVNNDGVPVRSNSARGMPEFNR